MIKDRGEKQVNALNTLKSHEKLTIEDKSNEQSIKKDIYNKILEEKIDQILEMSKKINHSNLVYDFKGSTPLINFMKFEGPMYTYNQLKNGDKTLQQLEEEQEHFKKDLNEIKSGNPRHKSEKQLYIIKIVKDLYDSRQKIINLLNDYSKIRSEAIFKSRQNNTTEGKRLKILTSKQMLQRLPIALAQVKAGNNSENLSNEIRQIIYSSYQAKEITKKVYNNLMKSL